MLRFEFEQLRDLPGKRIEGDLVFVMKRASRPSYVFGSIPVENSLGLELVVDGLYNPAIKKLLINFRVKSVGPICRVCVNGRLHDKIGRTHKHEFIGERDPAANLPNVHARLDLRGKRVSEVWQIICEQAQIEHNGAVVLPGGADAEL